MQDRAQGTAPGGQAGARMTTRMLMRVYPLQNKTDVVVFSFVALRKY